MLMIASRWLFVPLLALTQQISIGSLLFSLTLHLLLAHFLVLLCTCSVLRLFGLIDVVHESTDARNHQEQEEENGHYGRDATGLNGQHFIFRAGGGSKRQELQTETRKQPSPHTKIAQLA